MSTKKTMELIEWAEGYARDCDAEILWNRVRAAREEVKAIERAAKALDDSEVRRAMRHAPGAIQDALVLVQSIAREAK